VSHGLRIGPLGSAWCWVSPWWACVYFPVLLLNGTVLLCVGGERSDGGSSPLANTDLGALASEQEPQSSAWYWVSRVRPGLASLSLPSGSPLSPCCCCLELGEG
jgi:hypothetical protein